MDKKQLRILSLLDNMIGECKKCSLFQNGRAKPYWVSSSRFAIIGEAPGFDEVRENSPFVGKAGNILWDAVKRNGLSREDFLIINSVNCRPVVGNKNGKPSNEQMEQCRPWIRKYLKVLKPRAILILGGYALFTILGESDIMKHSGKEVHSREFDCPVVISVHPAFTIYNPSKGEQLLKESIEKFRGYND